MNLQIGIFFRSGQLRPFVQGLRKDASVAGRILDNLSARAVRAVRNVQQAAGRIASVVGQQNARLATFNRGQQNSLATVGRSGKVLDAQTKSLDRMTASQRTSERQTQSWTQGLGRAVRVVALLTAGFFGLHQGISQFGQSLTVFSEFEARLSGVEAVFDATQAAMDKFFEQTTALGERTVFTALQAAESTENLARAGFSVVEVLQTVPQTLNLAAAAELEMGDAARITAGLLRAFNLETTQTGMVTDILAKGSSLAMTTVGQLGEQMKFVSPLAARLGQTMQETTAAMLVLANQGFGDISGTALKRIFSGLAKPVGEAAKAIESMGLSLEEVDPAANSIVEIVQRLADANITAAEAFTLFGQRGGPAILALTSQAGDLSRLTDELHDVDGTALRMSETMRDNLRGDALILRSVIDSLRISFGAAFAPELREQLQRLQVFFRENRDSAIEFGQAMGKVAKAVTTAFITIGNHLSLILLLFGAFVGSKLLVWLGALGTSLVKRVIEWGSYSTATAAATAANTANAASSGRIVTLYGAQGQAIKKVTVATAASATTTGVASAATWTFAGAVRGLTAAIAANPVGLIVIGLTLLITTMGSVVGAVSEARAETEAYHTELREGRPVIDGVSEAHDRYVESLLSERDRTRELRSETSGLHDRMAALEPVARQMREALDAGDEQRYIELASEARDLGVAIRSVGRETAFEEVSQDLALMRAELEANERQTIVSGQAIKDAEMSLAAVVEDRLVTETRRMDVQRARLAELRAEGLRASEALEEAVDAFDESDRASFKILRLQGEVRDLRHEAKLAAEGIAALGGRIEGIADDLGAQISSLLTSGDLEGADRLLRLAESATFFKAELKNIDGLLKSVEVETSLFEELFPGETREGLLAFKTAIGEEGAAHVKALDESEAAVDRLNQRLVEQTARFKALKGSLADEAAALERLAKAALKGEEAFSEAQRAAEVERRFRSEAAKLTEINAGALKELRGEILRVVTAEKKLAGSKTIAALTRQADGLERLVKAYGEGSTAVLAVREALDLEAELRSNLTDVTEEQREEVERLTRSVQDLSIAAEAKEDTQAIQKEINALEGLADAFAEGTSEGEAFARQLQVQAKIEAKATPLLAQQARLISDLAKKKKQLAFFESNLVLGSRVFASVLQQEIAVIARQLNLSKEQVEVLTDQVHAREDLNDQVGRQEFLASLRDENELLRVELESLQSATNAEIQFGVAAREAAIAVAVQKQIMEQGAEGIKEYERQLRAAISENEALKAAIEDTDTLANSWGEVGAAIASAFSFEDGGALASLADGLQQVFAGIEGGVDSILGAVATGIVAAALSAGIAGGGTSAFGGERTRNFSAEGAEIGAAIGGASATLGPWGAVLGLVLGSFLEEAGDIATVVVRDVAGGATAQVDRAQGELRKFAEDLRSAFQAFVDEFEFLTGEGLNAGLADIHVEVQDDLITVTTASGVHGFREMSSALAFMVERLLIANESVEGFTDGLGENVARLIEGLTGSELRGSFEDVSEALSLASLADRVKAGQEEVPEEIVQRFREINALRERELELARKYGLNFEDVLRLTDLRIEQTRREISASVDGLIGVNNALSTVQAITASMEEFNRRIEQEAQTRQRAADEAAARVASLEEQIASSSEGLDGGVAAAIFREIREGTLSVEEGVARYGDAVDVTTAEGQEAAVAFLELARELGIAEEELAALEESLGTISEAFDAQDLIDVWEAGAAQAGLALIDLLQQIRGESFLAAEAEELKANLFLLQLAAQIAAVQALLAATDLLSDATRALLVGIVSEAEALFSDLANGEVSFRSARSGKSGRQEKQRERGEIVRDIEDLRLLASGVEESTLALRASFRDFDEWVERARQLGIAEEHIAQAREDNLDIIQGDLLAPFEEILRQAGESDLQTGIRQMGEEFQVALSDAFALASERAELMGTIIADEFGPLRDTILEAFGVQLGEQIKDEISSLAGDGDISGLQDVIDELLATDLSGISPDLQQEFRDLVALLVGDAQEAIDVLEASLPDENELSVDVDVSSIREFFDLVDGLSEVQVEVRELQKTFAGVVTELRIAGATEEDLSRVRSAHAAAIGQVREAVMESVQGYTDAVLGITEVDRQLMDLRSTFESARDGIAAADAALASLDDTYAGALDDEPLPVPDVGDPFVEAAVGALAVVEPTMETLLETFELGMASLVDSAADHLGVDPDILLTKPLPIVIDDPVPLPPPTPAPAPVLDGGSPEDLELLAAAYRGALLEIRDGILESVQEFTDQAQGIGELERRLMDLQGTFADARSGLESVDEALAGVDDLFTPGLSELEGTLDDVGLSTSELATDLDLLNEAERRAIKALGVDFINSLESLGVSLPTSLTLELAQAQFELARAEAISAALALHAAGAFEGLSISLDEHLGAIASAEFNPPSIGGGTTTSRRGNGGTGGAGADPEALRRQVEDQLRAWNRLPLGDVTLQAINLAETLNQLRMDAAAAGVAVEEVNAAFQVALDTFVNDALAPFENLSLSPLEAELDGILDRFVDLMVAFEVAGASAEQVVQLQEAFQSAMEDFLERATQGIRDFLEELKAEDPRLSGQEAFQGSQAEFRDLFARAQGGDLEALEQLEGAAREFRDQAVSFLGGGVGFQEVLDEIIGSLEGVEDFELVPDDIALLQDQVDALLAIIEIQEGQPTVDTQGDGFTSVGNRIDAVENAVTESQSMLQLILGQLENGEMTVADVPQVLEVLNALANDVSFLPDNVDGILTALEGTIAVADDLTQEDLGNILGAMSGVLSVSDDLSDDQLSTLLNVASQLWTSNNLSSDQVSTLGTMLASLLDVENLTDAQRTTLVSLLDEMGLVESNTSGVLDVEDTGVAGEVADVAAEIRGNTQQIENKLNVIRDRIGHGDLNSHVREVRNRLDTTNALLSSMDSNIANIAGAEEGAFIKRDGLLFVHANERVLSAPQTRAFEQAGGLKGLQQSQSQRSEPDRHEAERRSPGRPTLLAQRVRPRRPQRRRPSVPRQSSHRLAPSEPQIPHERPRLRPVMLEREPMMQDSPEEVMPFRVDRERHRDEPENKDEVVNSLADVEDAVLKGAKDERDRAREEMKLLATQIGLGGAMIEAMGDVKTEINELRRDMKVERGRKPVGGAE